ncbi:hypothetical protein CTI12_AA325340 [Artemisia annua]|uniref:RRM domain-containing protein n=1 Tax=Artemisia annua TaxID=35608 RepID=A0A2U1MZ37_ARTAN|nr:hypothetical protein CTI12_AA325340 [Artemisia annua]
MAMGVGVEGQSTKVCPLLYVHSVPVGSVVSINRMLSMRPSSKIGTAGPTRTFEHDVKEASEEYEAKVIVTSKLKYLSLIKEKLDKKRRNLFRQTCFDRTLHFGRPEFSLITGMHFGTLNFDSYSSGEEKFRSRVLQLKAGVKVTNLHLLAVIEDEGWFCKLSDDDAVRGNLEGLSKYKNYVPTYMVSGFVWAFKLQQTSVFKLFIRLYGNFTSHSSSWKFCLFAKSLQIFYDVNHKVFIRKTFKQMERASGEGEWTKFQRRRQQTIGQRTKHMDRKGWNADFARVIKEKATTFFFTRFPDAWDEKALWKLFEKYGTVVDIYLASKRTKVGTRFGFVQFIKVGNILAFEQKLGEICIGNSKILVNIAKYDKAGQYLLEKENKDTKYNGWQWTFGKNNMDKHQQQDAETKDYYASLQCGLSILCEWKSEEIANDCLERNKVNLGYWFSKLVMWEESLEPPGRLTWLEIEGLPALIWDSNAVRKIEYVDGADDEESEGKSETEFGRNIGEENFSDVEPRERKETEDFDVSISHVAPTFEKAAEDVDECGTVNKVAELSNSNSKNMENINVGEGPANMSKLDETNINIVEAQSHKFEVVQPKKRSTNINLEGPLGKSDSSLSKEDIGKTLGLVFEDDQQKVSREGEIISFNCCGLGMESKQNHIRDLIRKEKPSVLGIQETKMTQICNAFVYSIWGISNIEFVVGDAIGLSGGTLLMWDSDIFSKEEVLMGSHFVGVIGMWNGVREKIGIINIYGPQGSNHKEDLWRELISIINSKEAIWILFGDLNVVRTCEERLGSIFVERDAIAFNEFISNGGLHDFAIGGGGVDLQDLTGKSGEVNGRTADIILKKKLKKLKEDIKSWCRVQSIESDRIKNDIQSRLLEWDTKAEADQIGIPLNNLIVRKVNSGRQTQFWNDSWIKDRGPLRILFPRLYALETHKGGFVSERWVLEDGVWQGKWAWRRQPTGRAEGDLLLLVSLINFIVLDPTMDDKWIWTLNESGMFSVSSLSRAIQNQIFVNNDTLSLPYGILGFLASVHDFDVDHMKLEKQNPSCIFGGGSDFNSPPGYFLFGSKDVSPMGFSSGF